MKKISVFITLLSVVALSVSAQKKLYLSQHPVFDEWVDSPRVHPVPPKLADQPAIILLNDVEIDYRYEGRTLAKHVKKHMIVKVLNDGGIDEFRTIEIPLERGVKIPEIKARTILPSGEVVKMSPKKIKLALNSRGLYVVLIPMEGVEKNSEIEYLVKEVQDGHAFGSMYFQNTLPISKTRFKISYPKDLSFDAKSFNGFPDMKEELHNNRHQMIAEVEDIPALFPEKVSFYEWQRMAVEYRISYYLNGNKEKVKFNTWNKFARYNFDRFYNISKKEKEVVNKFLSELGVKANGNEVENIKKIEDGIKERIVLYSVVDYEERNEVIAHFERRSMSKFSAGYDERREVLDTVLTKKSASHSGYIRLFVACLRQAGIHHELGWAWDRTDDRYDPSFESWNGLDYALIYFPKQKKFLRPTSTNLRYPFYPYNLANSRGVFITIPERGQVTGDLYKIRKIATPSEQQTHKDISASLSFTKDMQPKADISYEWYGFFAEDLREKLPFARPDEAKEIATNIVSFTNNKKSIEKYSFSNVKPQNYSEDKPLTLYTSVNASALLEKAGYRYLVNVGRIIGNHADLYDEKKPRTTPVDLLYPYARNATITVNIPKGYRVLNLNDIHMEADYYNTEVDKVIGFESNYKLVKDYKHGDKLIITVKEFYKQIHFNKYEYWRFRKVYDAAADFANLTLVMTRR